MFDYSKLLIVRILVTTVMRNSRPSRTSGEIVINMCILFLILSLVSFTSKFG